MTNEVYEGILNKLESMEIKGCSLYFSNFEDVDMNDHSKVLSALIYALSDISVKELRIDEDRFLNIQISDLCSVSFEVYHFRIDHGESCYSIKYKGVNEVGII